MMVLLAHQFVACHMQILDAAAQALFCHVGSMACC